MLLVACSLTALLSLAPQDPGPASPRVVGVDEHGWPVFAESGPAVPGASARPGAAAERPATAPTASPPVTAPGGVSTRRGPALAEVFARVGAVADFGALDGVAAHCRLTVFDERGAVLGTREWLHEADLRDGVLRDRLALPDRLVHGRDGERVFATLHGLRLDSEEALAREQLGLLGMLLRAPWCFADAQRFELVATRDEAGGAGGRPATRWLEFRGLEAGGSTGAGAAASYELGCAADTMQPLALRYRLGPGRGREVRFGDWRQVDAVRLPFRLEWVERSGAVASALEIAELSVGHRFPDRQFRPLR